MFVLNFNAPWLVLDFGDVVEVKLTFVRGELHTFGVQTGKFADLACEGERHLQ